MTVIGFPATETKPEEWTKPKTLEDWPWEKDLGKPFGDINGIANPPEEEVNDLVRHIDKISPPHYKQNGTECIEITEHMSFCAGNAAKYIYRHLHKGDPIGDLKKAIWYLEREVARLEKR